MSDIPIHDYHAEAKNKVRLYILMKSVSVALPLKLENFSLVDSIAQAGRLMYYRLLRRQSCPQELRW